MRVYVSSAIVLFLFLSPISSLSAQDKYSLSGVIKNGETGEVLIGAAIIIREFPGIGALSNAYGFYSLTLPEGRYTYQTQLF